MSPAGRQNAIAVVINSTYDRMRRLPQLHHRLDRRRPAGCPAAEFFDSARKKCPLTVSSDRVQVGP